MKRPNESLKRALFYQSVERIIDGVIQRESLRLIFRIS